MLLKIIFTTLIIGWKKDLIVNILEKSCID